MHKLIRFLPTGMLAVLLLFVLLNQNVANAEMSKIRVGIGDVTGIDWLVVLIALEHAKQRGVDSQITYFKTEELANQAVVTGQMDMGLGTPYSMIQKLTAPIRILMQVYKIQFFAVADKEEYPNWKALDDGEIAVHSRTSATLALANLMARTHGINYKSITYLPGSQVRAVNLLKGTIKASYLDSTNTKFVLAEAPGRFHVLPGGDNVASDETLFAHREFVNSNSEAVDIVVEEFVKVLRRVAVDPHYAAEERTRLNLLTELPVDQEGEILEYFLLGAIDGMFPPNGGGKQAAKADLSFFSAAGQIEGTVESLKIDDFWYLEPLHRALEKLGSAQVNYTSP